MSVEREKSMNEFNNKLHHFLFRKTITKENPVKSGFQFQIFRREMVHVPDMTIKHNMCV